MWFRNYYVKKDKGKGYVFYIAQYPVRWTVQSALHFLPSLTDIPLRAKTKCLTFPPLSIARYSFIQLSQQGRQWRERKCPIFETVAKGDSNPGSLDCESGILPLSYRALLSLYMRLYSACKNQQWRIVF